MQHAVTGSHVTSGARRPHCHDNIGYWYIATQHANHLRTSSAVHVVASFL